MCELPPLATSMSYSHTLKQNERPVSAITSSEKAITDKVPQVKSAVSHEINEVEKKLGNF